MRAVTIALAAAAGVIGGGAAPSPPPAAPPGPIVHSSVITSIDWIKQPSALDMANYYPNRAQRMGIEGSARIECLVTPDGLASNCDILVEQPTDQGFGPAALKLSRLFRFRPETRDGMPVSGRVIIPVRFALPPDAPPEHHPNWLDRLLGKTYPPDPPSPSAP
jgi:TonB family protein